MDGGLYKLWHSHTITVKADSDEKVVAIKNMSVIAPVGLRNDSVALVVFLSNGTAQN